MPFQPLICALMQSLHREYSSDKVPQWLINRKVITCANKLWPVVAFRGDRAVGTHNVSFVSTKVFCGVRGESFFRQSFLLSGFSSVALARFPAKSPIPRP